MTAGEYFEQVSTLPIVQPQTLTRNRPIVVVAPHPDDESLGVGGLIAMARREEQDVTLVLVTDGTASHPNSLRYQKQELAALRRAELAEAGRLLGLGQDRIHELGLSDAAAPTSGPLFEQSLLAMSDIIAETGAKTIFVPWMGDPHCDHQMAALMGDRMRHLLPHVTLWSYPIWGWHLPATHQIAAPPPVGVRLDISSVQQIKREAIAAHVSQMTDLIADDPEGFRFSEETLAPFHGRYEYFIEVPA